VKEVLEEEEEEVVGMEVDVEGKVEG